LRRIEDLAMCRIVLLAAIGLGLGLTGKARADIAPPLPVAKDSVTVKIEVDEKAKGPKLVLPNGVFTQPRIRPKFNQPNQPNAQLENGQDDGNAVAQDDSAPEKPKNHLLIAGLALTLSLAFGGLWIIRKGGKGSLSGLTLLIAAGATLTVGAIVWANAPPPPFKKEPAKTPASLPTAFEGKAKVEFVYGAEPVRLILDKESYEKLKKGELTIPEIKPTSGSVPPPK
jgi:hypothetical protein